MSVLQFGFRRSSPLVLQTESTECGLACLAMIAGHHGHSIDLASLRRRITLSLTGMTLAHLIALAEKIKLEARAVKLDLDALHLLQLPAILHWDFNHFVVLTHVGHSAVTLHDPACGRKKLKIDELSKHFTGVALELAPSTEFAPKRERQSMTLPQLIGRLAGAGRALALVLLLAGTIEVFVLLSPLFMQWVVDQAIVSADRDLLTVLAAGFLLLVLVQVSVTALRAWILMILGNTLNLRLNGNLFRHLLRLPMAFFEKRNLGDVISRFESLSAIQRTLTTHFIEAIIDGVMVIVVLVMMLVYSWQLTAIVAAAAVLYGAVRIGLYRPLRRAQEEQVVREAKQHSNFIESVRGIQCFKLFNRQSQRQAAYQNLVVDHFNAAIRVQQLSIAFRALNGILFGLENILVIWAGAGQVLDNMLSVGMLFAFIAYKQQFTSRIIGFIEKGVEFKILDLHKERVSDIALAPRERDDHAQDTESVRFSREIEVRDLSFRYSDCDPYIFRGLNFTIKAGESVAIVGRSGCGKTTLLKLMLGLLPPTSGEICLDGRSLSQIGLHPYRDIIGTVMQDDQLLAGSIAQNISFFDAGSSIDRIVTCAQLAGMHQEITAMPMGYHTPIGEMGSVLSGGQKQRILLARALYKNPQILFLDEATSHLDVAHERIVSETVRGLNLTRIIIAHRPETIASADRIITLSEGRAECEEMRLPAHVAA